jgi:hypothetical protein
VQGSSVPPLHMWPHGGAVAVGAVGALGVQASHVLGAAGCVLLVMGEAFI